MTRAAALALLEFAASKRPKLLPAVLALVDSYLYERALILGVRDVTELAEVLRNLAQELNSLEEGGHGYWRHPRDVIDGANVEGLLLFAQARLARLRTPTRQQRTRRLARRLRGVSRLDHAKRMVQSLIESPEGPLDPIGAVVRGWRTPLADKRFQSIVRMEDNTR